VGADKASPTGDQNAHPAPFGATGACAANPQRASRRWPVTVALPPSAAEAAI
jgi:hypothetical protein